MFYLGLDLGQKRDHSAVAIVERRDQYLAFQPQTNYDLLVRHVERVPLGTPYPAIVAGVRKLSETDELAGQCSVVVDATGVGAPVVDLLKRAQLNGRLYPVTITGGERERESGGVWSVPKRDLIAGVEVALEKGQLRIAKNLRDAGSLIRELMDVKSTTKQSTGRIRYGADGCRQHDDLVIALALACWAARRPRNQFGQQRLV
jgi:hypothetical protein